MKKIYNLCLLILVLFVGTQMVNAQFAESGEVTKVENGVYYVLYETGEVEINYNDSHSYTLKGPGDIVSFEGLKTGLGSVGDFYLYADGKQIKKLGSGDFKRNTYQTYSNIAINSYTASTLKFDFPYGGSYTRKIKNVKVTMAQYLEGAPAEVTIPENYVNVSNSASFDFKWCNLGDITITSSNPSLFKVSTSSVAATQGKWGKTSVTVTCTHNVAGDNQEGTITISGGGKTQTVKVKSSTKKNTATIKWNIPENLAIDEVVANAVSIGDAPVTLTLTSLDENILKVEGTTVTAVGVGSADLIAEITETANYYGVKDTVKINVANKERQTITWDQNIAVIPTTTATVELTATTNSGLPLTYESSNPAVATVEGNILTIVGVGNTDIKVSAEGNDTYFPAYLTKGVVVYDPNVACPDVLLYDGEFTVKIGNTDPDQSYEISWENGKAPSTLSFDVAVDKPGLDIYDNKTKITITQLVNGVWEATSLGTIEVKYKDGVKSFGPIELNRAATSVRFLVKWNYWGTTATFTNVEVKQARYLESSIEDVVFNPLNLNAIDTKEITLSYSALASMCGVYLQKGDVFSVAEGITFGEGCGSVGSTTFTLTFSSQGLTAADCATYEDTILIINSQNETVLCIPVSGAVEQLRQTIDWTPAATTLRTIDTFTVPAMTSANLSITYTSSDVETAYINEEYNLVVLQAGTVTITATQEGNDTYQAAAPISYDFVITKTSYEIIPHLENMSFELELGQALSSLDIECTVTDILGNEVVGVIAFNPDSVPTVVGTQYFNMTFTPDNLNYYDIYNGDVLVKVIDPSTATALENITEETNKSRKVMRNGVMYIIRGEEVYTITGVRVM